jgi:hypothetical protein
VQRLFASPALEDSRAQPHDNGGKYVHTLPKVREPAAGSE